MIPAGTHVHLVDEPDTDLIVDVVAPQGAAPAWLVAHDRAGLVRYVPVDQTMRHGRHERPEDRCWPVGRGATIAGVLPVPPWPQPGRRLVPLATDGGRPW